MSTTQPRYAFANPFAGGLGSMPDTSDKPKRQQPMPAPMKVTAQAPQVTPFAPPAAPFMSAPAASPSKMLLPFSGESGAPAMVRGPFNPAAAGGGMSLLSAGGGSSPNFVNSVVQNNLTRQIGERTFADAMAGKAGAAPKLNADGTPSMGTASITLPSGKTITRQYQQTQDTPAAKAARASAYGARLDTRIALNDARLGNPILGANMIADANTRANAINNANVGVLGAQARGLDAGTARERALTPGLVTQQGLQNHAAGIANWYAPQFAQQDLAQGQVDLDRSKATLPFEGPAAQAGIDATRAGVDQMKDLRAQNDRLRQQLGGLTESMAKMRLDGADFPDLATPFGQQAAPAQAATPPAPVEPSNFGAGASGVPSPFGQGGGKTPPPALVHQLNSQFGGDRNKVREALKAQGYSLTN